MNREHEQNPEAFGPVVSEARLIRAEQRLGFALPPPLRKIYAEIENGHMSFLALEEEDDPRWPDYALVPYYLWLHDHGYMVPEISEVPIAWPTGLLPFWGWGCAIYSCVDCFAADNPVIFWDQYREEQFFIQSPSLALWLKDLQHGVDLFSTMYPKRPNT